MTTLAVGRQKIEVSNPDKVYFSEPGITKSEFVDYCAEVAGTMMRHAGDRPLTLYRFPDGLDKDGFFQQRAQDYFPDWIGRIEVESPDGPIVHPACENEASLVYLAEQATIEFHIWQSKSDSVDKPDRFVIDVDPPSADEFRNTVRAAELVKGVLEEVGLVPFAMLTGSKGIHVVAPIRPKLGFDEVREFARRVADESVEREPELVTTQQRKNQRGGRVYLDVLRNSYGQSTIAPYSVRARPGASVATPVTWDELKASGLRSNKYSLKDIPRRIKDKGDVWQGFTRRRRSLDGPMKRIREMSGK